MKKLTLLLLILVFSLIYADTYWVEKVSRVDLNPVEAIHSKGQVVYAGVGGMLNIYNIYQRDFPQLMGTIEGHSSRIKAIIVDDQKLYVLWEKEGLEIFDISDPYTPIMLGKFPHIPDETKFTRFTCMDLEGDIVYIGGANFVASASVETPESPQLLGYLGLNGELMKIDFYQNKLFAAAGELGLGLFMVPNPQNFYLYGTQEGIYTTIKAYRDIILYGRLDKPSPEERKLFGPHLFSFPFESPRIVKVRDDVVFAGGMANFATYRLIENQKDPVLVWSIDDFPTVDCVLKDDNIYLANSYEGFSVFDITNVEKPFQIGRVPTSDVPKRGCIVNNKFYVAAGRSGIILIDTEFPENPVIENRFGSDYLHTVWDVAYHDGSIFAIGARKVKSEFDKNIYIEEFDITGNWLAEYPITRLEKLDPIGEIVFSENYCALTMGSEGIYILDPDNFEVLYNINDGSVQFCDIVISQDYLYASDYFGGYQIWRLGDGTPKFVSSIRTSEKGGNGIELVGKYLLAADGPNGLAIIDVSNPETPNLVNSYPTIWGTDLVTEDNILYFSDGQGAMKVFDISNLPEIKLVDELPHSGYWTHIYAENNTIYGIDAFAGIYIYKLTSSLQDYARKSPVVPSETKIIDALPNPFNSATSISFLLSEKTDVNLSIYDMKGQKITTLIDDVVPAGKYTLRWTPDSKNIPSGTYFAVLNTPDVRSEQRLLLVK
ncbi:hypothetical protein DRQ33_04405 [bacterium]|nr:MAG: hypothetical protein DRQ33_04405 [bacterium]